MKHYLKYVLCILLISLSVIGYAKGSAGSYYIKGIAYAEDKTILANTLILVRIGNDVQEIKTDGKGQFEFEVPWIVPCRSGVSHDTWEKERNRLNPEFIYIKCGAAEMKLKNEWEKYAGIFSDSKEEVTEYEDLIFNTKSK